MEENKQSLRSAASLLLKSNFIVPFTLITGFYLSPHD